jgi:hypothetical protein
VPIYAVAVGMYPIRSSYRYLKKLHKYSYLWRGYDFRGRIVYRLSPRGSSVALAEFEIDGVSKERSRLLLPAIPLPHIGPPSDGSDARDGGDRDDGSSRTDSSSGSSTPL